MPTVVKLTHTGGGHFRAASNDDYLLCTERLDSGEIVRASLTRSRSVPQNAFFHALVQAAFANQRGGPRLPTWRHLRSWLIIQAGHCTVTEFSAESMTPQVAATLRQAFDTVDFATNGKTIFMKVARSISFLAADADEMQRVVSASVEIICQEIVPGVQPEDLLAMAKCGVA